MDCLSQRKIHTFVTKGDNGKLLATTNYSDNNSEIIARLTVNENTFVVVNASIEKHDSNNESIKSVEELVGLEAYFGSGKHLREALERRDSLEVSLFTDTVRGIIQAETYLLKERGFSSPQEYSSYWDKIYLNSCGYYSNLDKVASCWDQQEGAKERSGHLFLRFKTYLLYGLASGGYVVISSLKDSFHNINVTMEVDESFLKVQGKMLRVPDQVCRNCTKYLQNLIGIKALELPKKELAQVLGKGQGCIHLVDLVDEGVATLKMHLRESC
ncbi:MAG: DUF2889 domain-containing protein [Bacillota bacterium]|nr:DUF2889 domain-containing protein [Bacillota bacterium]